MAQLDDVNKFDANLGFWQITLDPGEYHIELEPDVRPYDLSTPRRIPITIMSKVKKELESMETSVIISLVEQPTDW